MKLPIQASLVTRDGFQKPIIIEELKPVIHYPKMAKFSGAAKSTAEIDISEGPEVMEFYLERYKEVRQKNGKPHIVAVYREF